MLRQQCFAAFLVLVVSIGFGGCSSSVAPPANAPVVGVPATIEFGSVRVGLFKDTSVAITNSGNAPLLISGQSFSSAQFTLADTSQKALTIAAGSYQDVRIHFAPKDSGDILAYDTIRSNAGVTIVKLHAGGIALTRVLSFDAAIDFASVRIGLCGDSTLGATATGTLVLRNSGNDSVGITSIASASTDFSILSFPSSIPAGGSGPVVIRFCPTKVGLDATLILITSNATTNNATPIAAAGSGVPYSPGVGSSFTYQSLKLDSAGKPTGASNVVTTNIVATGLNYNGKSGVSQVNDGATDTYFKIEDDGDVSIYSKGYPTVDSLTYFGGSWWKLPAGTHGQNIVLFSDSTSFTGNNGLVGLRVSDTAIYKGDTVITAAGRTFTAAKLLVTELAVYTSGPNKIAYVGVRELLFAPSIGFTVAQFAVTDAYTVAGLVVKEQGGGEYRLLKAFSVK